MKLTAFLNGARISAKLFKDRRLYQPASQKAVIGAYTATATKAVREDILCILGLRDPKVMVTGYDRKNLYFAVEKPKDKTGALLEYLRKNPEKSGIIYCSTRKTVEEVHETLLEEGYPAVRYHAGLSDKRKRRTRKTLSMTENLLWWLPMLRHGD